MLELRQPQGLEDHQPKARVLDFTQSGIVEAGGDLIGMWAHHLVLPDFRQFRSNESVDFHWIKNLSAGAFKATLLLAYLNLLGPRMYKPAWRSARASCPKNIVF